MNKSSLNKNAEKISVRDFYESFKDSLMLELYAGESGLGNNILEVGLNRPALAITGYFKNFAEKRIQLFGAGEISYLKDLSYEKQKNVMTLIAKAKIPCVIVSRNLSPTKAMMEVFKEYSIPTFRTTMSSRSFSNELALGLEAKFAPRTQVHGTLIDLKGIGTLIKGASGIGKSECALALIENGHSLVADDLTYCKRIGGKIIGRSNDINRGFMECRGIGIINVAELFGIKCVRLETSIDLIVNFVEWRPGINEERTGLEQNYHEILGVNIPHIEIPVRPGRDMARLVEVAAMVQALRYMGHDSAKEFNEKLIAHMTKVNL